MSILGNDIIIGGGQVGKTLSKLFHINAIIDVADPKTVNLKVNDVDLMHVCFPYNQTFIHDVVKYTFRYSPKLIIIHSTVSPGTTETLSSVIDKAVVYSPIRGIHSRFADDIRKYTKFFAIEGLLTDDQNEMIRKMEKQFGDASIVWKSWKDSRELEFAKIMTDTTYYGWLITFRHLTDIIAKENDIDPETIWEFAKEIHENLGNRPIMYSDKNGIGGHCVLPNLDLIHSHNFSVMKDIIFNINEERKNL